MSTGPIVLEQLDKVIKAHRVVHHHAVREARALRALKAAENANMDPSQVQVPDLEPEGMPGVADGVDPLAGL